MCFVSDVWLSTKLLRALIFFVESKVMKLAVCSTFFL